MPQQDEYQTSLPEITISPKKKRIVNAAGNPQLQQASQNYIDKAVQEEIEKGATAMREGLNDATKVAAPIVAAAALPAVASTGTIGTVVNGIKALAPGSTFWMNPVTKQMFTSTLGGNVWNGAYKGLTGNDWDDAVANQTEQLTGWNPQNSPWTSWMPGMTNPGYILPYNVVSNVTNGIINSIESRIPVKPKFTKDIGLNIPIEKLVTIEGLNFSKVHPNFPRGSSKRQVEELINSIIDKHSILQKNLQEKTLVLILLLYYLNLQQD